ncbi:MAG: hypothetical protein ACTSRZ_14000 [Promethearchaeota archaeon]
MSSSYKSDIFEETLWEVIEKEASFINTQIPRLIKLWELHLGNLPAKLPEIHEFKPNKDYFYENNVNKIAVLRELERCLVEGYKLIKFIVDVIFNKYFNDSKFFLETFNEQDRVLVKYKAAEVLIGSLLQFLNSERDLISLKYIIISKNKSMLRIKEMTDQKIYEKTLKDGFKCKLKDIHHIFDELTSLNMISKKEFVEESGNSSNIKYVYKWNLNKDFSLSSEGEKAYKTYIHPILEWAVGYWRSIYNVRALDVKIPEHYKWRTHLEKITSRAATQGFKSAYWVIKNIRNYYEYATGIKKINN